MKKYFYIFAFITLLFTQCNSSNKTANNESITVSILPQKYFVEQIIGNAIPINVMLPPGASPADYEPTPKQIKDLSSSSIYFFIGHLGFEKSWMKKFSQTANTVNYISCSKGLDLLRGDAEHEELHHEKDQHGTDPHIWTSPENVKIISRTICTTLVEKYPSKAKEFESNLARFIAKIDTLDNTIRTTLTDSTNNAFMIFHPALGYFARDYHLEQYAIEFEGKSPSPAHMKAMIDLARRKKISTIFVQSQFETSKAEAVAKEINAQVVSIDPLSEDWLTEMHLLNHKMKKALSH
jgi:zinc transport system substrate-binding protein